MTDETPHGAAHPAKPGHVRLIVDLPVEDAEVLEETAARSGYNRVTTVVRALRLLAELDDHQRSGGEILLRSSNRDHTDRLRLL